MESPQAVVRALPRDLLICVFVHGFKGDDKSFGDFPNRLQHNLTETVQNVSVECVVFPAYETKGDLTEAVEAFGEWLAHLIVKKEVDRAVQTGYKAAAGHAKIVLMGHSMGGLVIADSLIALEKAKAKKDPLWPRIIAVIGFDTPYLGLHPSMFQNKASEAIGYVGIARDVATTLGVAGGLVGFGKSAAPARPATPVKGASSGWGTWAAVGGALLAAGAAAAVYTQRENVAYGWNFATDHMKYVGTLWDVKAMKTRLSNVIELGKSDGIVFRNFYVYLPVSSGQTRPRTFIVLPKKDDPAAQHFIVSRNSRASDEVAAHMGMFDPSSNDGYYDLGLRTAGVIREAIASLLESEKTMSVPIQEDQKAEMARNKAQVAEDGVAAEATTQTVPPHPI